MKITLIVIGKTKFDYLQKAESDYLKRLEAYCEIDYRVLNSPIKSNKIDVEVQKKREKEIIIPLINSSDYVVLLDEKGKSFTSIEFADWIDAIQHTRKRLVFIVGGAYGFNKELYNRAELIISLSKMTFSHQMIRTFFLEQLYRSFSINNNKPYHH